MRKVIISGMVGNGMEWYDFAIYAQFIHIISLKFFPESRIAEILTFGVFALGFVFRPLGGVVFGYIGDRYGRRIALALGILTMAIPTAGIGLLPSYESIGIAAPIILAIIRLIQGFALGGEFSGCIAYIVEHSPKSYRGLSGSTSFVSMCLGMLAGIGVANLFGYFLSEEALLSWGWRVPFIFGFFIGLVGLYIRTHLAESPIYKEAKEKGFISRSPLRDTIKNYWRTVLMAMIVYINVTAPFYTTTIFMKSYMLNLGYSDFQSSITNTIILVTMTLIFPISAYFSDKIGRKPIIIAASIALVIGMYPIFIVTNMMVFEYALVAQIIFAMIVGVYMGPVPTLLVEMFPTKIRFTGVAISYNLSAAIFGGTAPMIGAALYEHTGNELALAYYLTFLALFCLICICFFKETYNCDLSNKNNNDYESIKIKGLTKNEEYTPASS